MKSNIIEILTGGLVLALASILLFYAYVREHHTKTTGYPLLVSFERVDGLVEGSDVKIGGIKVGKIEKLSLDPQTFSAVATITLRDGVKLPKDSSAAITSESLLGGKYLDLVPGGDEDFLAPGEKIKHSQSSVNLESLIGQAIFSKDEKKQ